MWLCKQSRKFLCEIARLKTSFNMMCSIYALSVHNYLSTRFISLQFLAHCVGKLLSVSQYSCICMCSFPFPSVLSGKVWLLEVTVININFLGGGWGKCSN